MDADTARSILGAAMGNTARGAYQALAAIVGQADVREVRTPDGTSYQLELQVLRDEKPGGRARVLGAIDDGRRGAFWPLTLDCIRNPDGTFAGE
jgi:hypothetical protein